jgi:hypothetical protein
LGLAIVYQIVQAHEGKVWARSKLGQGSVFVLRLHRFAAGEAFIAPPTDLAHQSQPKLLDTVAAAVGGGARG